MVAAKIDWGQTVMDLEGQAKEFGLHPVGSNELSEVLQVGE